MSVMDVKLSTYRLSDSSGVMTPALLIYPELVDRNIRATLAGLNGDANRWRPHVKTAKLGAIIRRLVEHGVVNFKCSTTLELLTSCQAGASDVLLAFSVMGANARRAIEIADQFPQTRVSVLVESGTQAASWHGADIGVFLDLNPGMDRTGITGERVSEIVAIAHALGPQFRGLHFYDGHISAPDLSERRRQGLKGYDDLLALVRAIEAKGVPVREVITSGTPATPVAIEHPGLASGNFVHRVSPGTVVYNDTSSLTQLPPEWGYVPAVVVLAAVLSHPLPNRVTCDAGHKSVSVDSGVPNCAVAGYPHLTPLKPSEEHLPIETAGGAALPALGEHLYLIPRHVCPTVNNFDQALMVVNGEIVGVEKVTARGHENPLAHRAACHFRPQ